MVRSALFARISNLEATQSSFETRPRAAPQDEENPCARNALMVRRRSCAVSNHKEFAAILRDALPKERSSG
jgi:hypothetical protein